MTDKLAPSHSAIMNAAKSEDNLSDYMSYILNDATEKKWVKPKRLDPSVQHNSFCEVCNKTEHVSYGKNLVACIYCNVVAHVSCMKKYQRDFRRSKNWVCYYCKDYLQDSKGTFEYEKKRAERIRAQIKSQIILAKYFRRYVARKFFIAIYTVIIKLQVLFRVRKRKKQFLLLRQSKLRSIKVRIHTCHDLIPKEDSHNSTSPKKQTTPTNNSNKIKKDNYYYILVTVIDTANFANTQIWKVQSDVVFTPFSLNPRPTIHFDCTVLLPGVSGFQHIVLTVFQKGNSRDIYLGQTYVDLSQNYVWKKGGRFVNRLGDQEYPIKDNIGLEMKSEYRFPPRGKIDFELQPCSNMSSECGLVYGTCIEDLIRTLHQLPDFAGITQPTAGLSATAGLKKKGYGSLSSSPEFFNIPLKKIWIAIVDGTLYVYPHFTDSLKLIVHMEFFTPSTEIKNKMIIFKLNRPGYPSFNFSVVNNEDMLRWKCAFICSTKYKSAINMPSVTSHISGSKPSLDRIPTAFDMNLLITDIMKIDNEKHGPNHDTNNNNNSTTKHKHRHDHNESSSSSIQMSHRDSSHNLNAATTTGRAGHHHHNNRNSLKNIRASIILADNLHMAGLANNAQTSYAAQLTSMFESPPQTGRTDSTGLSNVSFVGPLPNVILRAIQHLKPIHDSSHSGSGNSGHNTPIHSKSVHHTESNEHSHNKLRSVSLDESHSPSHDKHTSSLLHSASGTSHDTHSGSSGHHAVKQLTPLTIPHLTHNDKHEQNSQRSTGGSSSRGHNRLTERRHSHATHDAQGHRINHHKHHDDLNPVQKEELKHAVKEEYSIDDAITNPDYVKQGEEIIGNMMFHVATRNLLSRHGIKASIAMVSTESKKEGVEHKVRKRNRHGGV